MIKNLYEIFDEVAAAPDAEARKVILRNNDSALLRTVLNHAFDPKIKFYTDTFPPMYVKNNAPPGMGYGNLHQDIKKLKYFIEDHPAAKKLSKRTKDLMLTGFLEAIEDREAQVIINMMGKDLKVPGLTFAVIQEAFFGN